MYKDRTQNYDPKIHEEYLTHDTPIPLPHHLYPCADYSIAINTTNYTEKQQYTAVSVSLKSGFLKVFL